MFEKALIKFCMILGGFLCAVSLLELITGDGQICAAIFSEMLGGGASSARWFGLGLGLFASCIPFLNVLLGKSRSV
jgi:hypothetical protein